LKITVRNFQKKIPVNPKRIKRAILKVLSLERLKITGEITVCFVNDRKIKELNARFHHENRPTDVLAFDLSGRGRKICPMCADIIISSDTALSNAKLYNTSPMYELYLYVVHGMLHLLGHNDRTAKERQAMQIKAEKVLELLRIKKQNQHSICQ
jgi:probable rRNA maturation factor